MYIELHLYFVYTMRDNSCGIYCCFETIQTTAFILFRRADRQPENQNDRICSCHFKEGKKEGDPVYFAWNDKKYMDFPDPEKSDR